MDTARLGYELEHGDSDATRTQRLDCRLEAGRGYARQLHPCLSHSGRRLGYIASPPRRLLLPGSDGAASESTGTRETLEQMTQAVTKEETAPIIQTTGETRLLRTRKHANTKALHTFHPQPVRWCVSSPKSVAVTHRVSP